MPPHQSNVRLNKPSATGSPLRFEKLLLANRQFNRILSKSAQWFLTALIWPRFVAPYRWRLTRYPLPLANLDSAFQGYRLLHLTDLHVGKARFSYLLAAIDIALDQKPDLVVITGDLID